MQLKVARKVQWHSCMIFLIMSAGIQVKLQAKPIPLDSDTIIIGGGCFWCIEPIMESLVGVINATSGYAGGTSKAPTYNSVCLGKTGHAEVVQVNYDKNRISLTQLLEVFFESHDPTTLNRQGADIGSQYRSIILYRTEDQKQIIDQFIKSISKHYKSPIVTEITLSSQFYEAEQYHQDYFQNNKSNRYCTMVIEPKLKKAKEQFSIIMNQK